MLSQELKKLFRPRLVLAALALGILYYSLFLSSFGSLNMAVRDMQAQWVQTYGTVFSPADIRELGASLDELNAQADRYLAAHPIAQKYGITDHQSYLAWAAGDFDTAQQILDDQALFDYLTGPETGDIFSRAQITESVIQEYGRMEQASADHGYDKWSYDSITPRELAHVKAVFHGRDEALRNFSPARDGGVVADYTVLTLLWTCVFLGPAMTRERMSRMIPTQYASRRGRSHIRTQLTAYLTAALLCTAASALVFGAAVLWRGREYAFLRCRMFTFWQVPYCWPNWTMGVWYLFQWAMSALLAMAGAGALFLLSRTSGNYVSMLFKLIPVFCLLRWVITRTLTDSFYFSNALYRTAKIPYIETAVPAALAVLTLGLCAWYVRRIRRQDVLSP